MSTEETPPRPIGIYVHIPFCIHKCGYCDFNSYALDRLINQGHCGEDWARSYTDALLTEFKGRMDKLPLSDRPIQSVFFGGGTPSLFPVEEINRILETLRIKLELLEDAEITLEANPGAADGENFAALKKYGINRLSIGVQSFDEESLSKLDRIHSGEDARQAFLSARAAGFSNISLDLMFGIPYQTLEGAKSDIQSALNLTPEHLSIYELTIESGTNFEALFKRGALQGLPSEKVSLEMWEMRNCLLNDAGYERYEISNFAKPGFQCLHNVNYWKRGEYLGLGAGAHSFFDGKRFWNHARPDIYIKKAVNPTLSEEFVGQGDKAVGESLMLGLRLREGVSLEEIAKICQADPEKHFGNIFLKLEKNRLIKRVNGKHQLTQQGTLLANQVLSAFL